MVVIMCSLVFIGFVTPVTADGAVQISGIGLPDDFVVCSPDVTAPDGRVPDYVIDMTGDLDGCHYVFVETWDCSPSGTYRETGFEMYVSGGNDQLIGTFLTTYQFEGKFEGCSPEGFPVGAEIFGRCQHPIAAGSGTGDYEGVTGRLAFKDDVVNWIFPYKGHLKW